MIRLTCWIYCLNEDDNGISAYIKKEKLHGVYLLFHMTGRGDFYCCRDHSGKRGHAFFDGLPYSGVKTAVLLH